MTRTNPFRSPRAHHVALALVAGVAMVATLLFTTTPIRDAEAGEAPPAPRQPLVDAAAPAAAATDLGTTLRDSVEPIRAAEQHGRFAAAWARAEAARLEAERIAAEQAAARAAAEKAAAARASAGGGAMGGGWAALRRCESGGNYRAVSASGTYRGAYQFSRSTWNSVAARSYPHLVGVDPAAAAPADQDAMALALYRSSGSRPWPHCGRHL